MTTSPTDDDRRSLVSPGDRVQTAGGQGVVRNVATIARVPAAILVELDSDRDRQPLWRSYPPDAVTPA